MRAIACVLSGIILIVLTACTPVGSHSNMVAENVIARSDLQEIPPFRNNENTSASASTRLISQNLQQTKLLDSDPAIKAFVEKQIASVDGVPPKNPRERFDALVEAFRSPHILNIRYVADATYTASETFQRREGNCLSLSALFLVMARYAGLNTYFQDVELLPNWRKDSELFVLEKHVNVVVILDGKMKTVDFLFSPSDITTAQIKISDAEAEAQYFNNLGVAALAAANHHDAYWLFRRSIELAPRQAYLWANLGVSLSRNQQYVDARQVYLQALSIDPFNTVAISNLLALRDQQPEIFAEQNIHFSAQLQQRVTRMREENPFYHYWRAERAFAQGKFRQSIRDMQMGIKLKRDESRFYLLMMKAGLSIGDREFARNNLQKARQYAKTDQDRIIYDSEYLDLQEQLAKSAK